MVEGAFKKAFKSFHRQKTLKNSLKYEDFSEGRLRSEDIKMGFFRKMTFMNRFYDNKLKER